MTETMLNWMRRFQRKTGDLGPESQPLQKMVSEQQPPIMVLKEKKSPQKSLDGFIGKKPASSLYDDNFNFEDLKLVTRRWREKNLAVNE